MVASISRTNGKASRARKTQPSRIKESGPYVIAYTTSGGVTITPNSSLTYSAIYGAVTLISSTLGMLPLNVIRKYTEDGRSRRAVVDDHPVAVLLKRSPNSEMTPLVFKEYIGRCLCLWGNFFAEIVRDGSTDNLIVALVPLEPDRVRVQRNENTYRLEYAYNNDSGAQVILSSEDVLHIKLFGDGIVGKSPISMARQLISMGLAAETFATAFFGNGLAPSGILSHPESLSEEAQRRLTKQMEGRLQGARNAGRLLVLEEDMKFMTVGVPAKDAQFLELRIFQVQEVCRIFRIPPHMLAENTRATFNNITHQAIEFVQYCLQHYMIRIEEELQRKLLTNDPDLSIKFNVDGLLRGDPQSRAQLYKELFFVGAVSPNDIREKEDMDPLGPEGDETFVQTNVMTLKNAVKAAPVAAPSQEPMEAEDEDEDETETMTEGTSDVEDERALVGTFRTWMRDAVGRLVSREVHDLRTSIHKSTSVEDCQMRIVACYRRHERDIREILGPIWERQAVCRGQLCDLDKCVSQYIADSRDPLLAVVRQKGAGDALLMLDVWEMARADSIVDRCLGMAYACTTTR